MVNVDDGGSERKVLVTINLPNPKELDELDSRSLAQEAWLTPTKRLTKGNMTVDVENWS